MNKEVLKKFTLDPEWHIIEDIIISYINPLMDINNIDLNDAPEIVKAEIKVRKQMYSNITKLLQDFGLLKETLKRTPQDYK